MTAAGYRILTMGDSALTVEFAGKIDEATNQRVQSLYRLVLDSGLRGVRSVIPSYRSLTLRFDPAHFAVEELEHLLANVNPEAGRRGRLFTIPVVYGGEAGPDLTVVAQRCGLTPEEVVRRHTAVEYRVYMIGFLPGFPYLGGLDTRLVLPRRETPLARIPGGSVAIAGEQAGIYPLDSPGGWWVLGRTSIQLFDPGRASPALLAPGDRVRFEAVS
ncbi:MAG: 5-oxoprolinase subunit PxpB [Bacillota bacterium]